MLLLPPLLQSFDRSLVLLSKRQRSPTVVGNGMVPVGLAIPGNCNGRNQELGKFAEQKSPIRFGYRDLKMSLCEFSHTSIEG